MLPEINFPVLEVTHFHLSKLLHTNYDGFFCLLQKMVRFSVHTHRKQSFDWNHYIKPKYVQIETKETNLDKKKVYWFVNDPA